MDDDELTRARRAMRGVDPELDLARAYAQSRTRAHGAEAHEDWASDERVEIVLSGIGPDGRRTRRVARRGPVLAWGAVAAAAAAALVVSVAGLPVQPTATVPGSAPSAGMSPTTEPSDGTSPTPVPTPPPTLVPTPTPTPSTGLTAAVVVDNAAEAVAAATCGVKTVSTLGEESKSRFDDAGTTDTGTPKPTPLDQQPLQVLQTLTVGTMLDLADLEGTDYRLHDSHTLEEDDGTTLARIRFTPPPGLVQGGEVTRMELLVDTATWLPHTEQTWGESDAGREHLLLSQFDWTTCGGASPSATDAQP